MSFVRNYLLKGLYHSFCIPFSNEWQSCVLTSFSGFGNAILNFSHSSRYRMTPHCFDLCFPNVVFWGASFQMCICYLYFFFGEIILPLFKLCWLFSYCLVFKGFFLIFKIQVLYQIFLASIFSQFVVYIFILNTIFCCVEVLNFRLVQFIFLSWIVFFAVIVSKLITKTKVIQIFSIKLF